jgi:PPK2 family polyphosphate:nucleotide phosphotransferase
MLERKDLKPLVEPCRVSPGAKVSLHDYDPGYTAHFLDKDAARAMLDDGIALLSQLQDRLYAQNTYGLLVVVQARDAAGKDSTIKHVMSGVNPQGCQVYSFKVPSPEEQDHDYLWRNFKALPERGRIGIFNRSYYEEALVVRVHPEILAREQLPPDKRGDDLWHRRFEEINHFERYLVDNGIEVLKIYLNVSKDEQKKRFLERIDRPEKNWKFSLADAKERAFWADYEHAYEAVLSNTSTDWAPWHIVPSDHKWFTQLAVAALIADKLLAIDPHYPTLDDAHQAELRQARELLLAEK